MSLIRKHVAVLQAWACLDLVLYLKKRKIRILEHCIQPLQLVTLPSPRSP